MRSNSLFSPTTAPNHELTSPEFVSPPPSDQKKKPRKRAVSEPLSSRKLRGPFITRNDFNYENLNLNVEALNQQGLELVGDPLPSGFPHLERMYATTDYRFLFRNKNDNLFYTLPMAYLFSKQGNPTALAQSAKLAEGDHSFIIKKIDERTVLRLKNNIGVTGTSHKRLAGNENEREPGKVVAGGEMYLSKGTIVLITPKTGNYKDVLEDTEVMRAFNLLFTPSEIEAYDENYGYADTYSGEEALEIQDQKQKATVAATLFNLVIRVDTNARVNSFLEALETAVINKVVASTLADNGTTATHPDDENTKISLSYRR